MLDEHGVILPCPACRRRNRIRYESLGRPTRCSQCHVALPPPQEPWEVPSATVLESLRQRSALPVLVDFWAPWCGPCKMVAPELARLATLTADRLLVVKVNTEALPALAQRHVIQSIPTFVLLEQGQEVRRLAGARSAAELQHFALPAG